MGFSFRGFPPFFLFAPETGGVRSCQEPFAFPLRCLFCLTALFWLLFVPQHPVFLGLSYVSLPEFFFPCDPQPPQIPPPPSQGLFWRKASVHICSPPRPLAFHVDFLLSMLPFLRLSHCLPRLSKTPSVPTPPPLGLSWRPVGRPVGGRLVPRFCNSVKSSFAVVPPL